ncbi:NAD-dependent epimerase/dehydratase family protein [Mesorhizobium sp. WSM2239]|uniref:NAD-dependent epimerase/dehydratase family protein n=2 Tax=unclassified Mesorhizobium TaxID=325217 RepID=A0AAU8DK47_9HYPH
MVVTGGSGFIGLGVREALRQRGLPHRAVSRSPREGCIMIGEMDANTDWSAALVGATSVIHLAGLAHQTSPVPPIEDFRRTNVDGSIRLVRQAAKAGVKRVVFVSSIGVLGQTTKAEPLTEASPPTPNNSYTTSKYEAELALAKLCGDLELELVIVRPPLVYGRGAKGNFGKLERLATSGLPLPFGSVRNRRNIISRSSLSDALVTCAVHPLAANETFVVAEKEAVSTAEIIAAIARAKGRKPRLFSFPPTFLARALRALGYTSMAEGLLSSLEIDSSKIAAKLNWQPATHTLENIQLELRT